MVPVCSQAAVLILTAPTVKLSSPTPSVSVVLLPPTDSWPFLPRSVSASKGSSNLTVFAQLAQTDVPAALVPPPALSVLSVPPITTMALALAVLDSTLQLLLSGSALPVPLPVPLALLLMLALPVSLTLSLPMVFVHALQVGS